jgi:pyruvate-formate lyase-activating enzyme
VRFPGRERGCRGSCRTSRNCQGWRRERDLLDLMGVPEVVTKRRKREREVGCGSREGAEVVLWLPEVVRV